MAQTLSCQPLTAKAPVRSCVSPCDICGGKRSNGVCSSSSASALSCQYHSTNAPHIHLYLHVALTSRTRGKPTTPSKKQFSFGNRGALEGKGLVLGCSRMQVRHNTAAKMWLLKTVCCAVTVRM